MISKIFKEYFIKAYLLIILSLLLINPTLFKNLNIFNSDIFWSVAVLMLFGLLIEILINSSNYKLDNINFFKLFGALFIVIIAILIKYKVF